MIDHPRHSVLAGLVAGVLVALSVGATEGATQKPGARQKAAAPLDVTPVEGPSTLHRLHRTIEGSSMGWGGQWSAPLNLTTPTPPRAGTRGDFVLSGADLYRISCRACHRPNGEGAPPEINSIIGPVQSASVSWLTERMKAMGRPVDPAFIRELTSSTEADLLKRFKTGGHDMPSFDHLSDDEIRVLRPFLDQMAGLPGAEARQRFVSEPSARVGELIIKGTCHICHDATGPDKTPTSLNDIIPPLSSMSHQKTFADFVRKVRQGAPIPVGSAGMSSRGRMPVFNYLSEREAEAAYSYLSQYPPK
jgi:mono/diheme cytochrome c family protein